MRHIVGLKAPTAETSFKNDLASNGLVGMIPAFVTTFLTSKVYQRLCKQRENSCNRESMRLLLSLHLENPDKATLEEVKTACEQFFGSDSQTCRAQQICQVLESIGPEQLMLGFWDTLELKSIFDQYQRSGCYSNSLFDWLLQHKKSFISLQNILFKNSLNSEELATCYTKNMAQIEKFLPR